MTPAVRNVVFCVAAAGLLSGCGEGEIVNGFTASGAVAHGRVTTTSGEGVEGVRIEAETWKDESWNAACPGEGGERIGATGDTTSSSDGSYTLMFEEHGVGPGARCLVLVASPPSGSSLESASDTVRSIMLREEPPLDSAEVDLTLPSGE